MITYFLSIKRRESIFLDKSHIHFYEQKDKVSETDSVSKHLFTLQSFAINKLIHVSLALIVPILMIKCEHCDVDAHYRLSIEDFNSAEVYSANLCIKCIEIEESKSDGDLPVTKSLKIQPLLPKEGLLKAR
jgi:hypothetical protein